MLRVALLSFVVAASSACRGDSSEEQFFRGDVETRIQRIESYELPQQWKIFLYGNQKIHPPATALALPMAKQGKVALAFILKELKEPTNDLDFRDSLVVFQMMQWGGYYNICSDESAMAAIRGNQRLIRDPDWRRIYGDMLGNLCRHDEQATAVH